MADTRVTNALESKLERETKWTRKMARNGIGVCESIFKSASNKTTMSKWSAIQKTIKDILKSNRSDYWSDYIKPLIQQGKMLEFISVEQSVL